MKNIKPIPVCVYCDSTGLFSETECNNSNLTEMLFPVWIVEAWYKKNEKTCIEECKAEGFEPNFDNWFNKVCTADSTDGLYDFSIQNGYEPRFGIRIDNAPNAVVYENLEYDTVIAFQGTTMECRKWAKGHDWKITIGYNDTEVVLDMLFH